MLQTRQFYGMVDLTYNRNILSKKLRNQFKCITYKQVEFTGANRQFDYLETSLLYNKSDFKIYDSYYLELASTLIKNVNLKTL